MGIYMCVFAVCVTAIIIAYMLITQNSNENSNVNLTFEKKDEPQIYGNEYNCIMTMFGECSYAETGCGDCAVVEKVRKALAQTENNSEKPNNCEDEPQYEMGMGTLKCDNCSEYGSFKCAKCDGEMYFKRLEPKDEPQKWETPPKFEHKGVITTCVSVPAWAVVDEPQTERSV